MAMLVLINFLVGLLLAAVSAPIIRGRVKPNRWYGFRTPKTLRDERIWYAANAYSGRTLFIAGMITAVAALALAPLYLLPHIGEGVYALAWTATMLASVLWSLIKSFRYLARL